MGTTKQAGTNTPGYVPTYGHKKMGDGISPPPKLSRRLF